MKRQRGRNRRSNNQNPNRSMESNGPDVKVRGSAKQIFDKYEALARDAAASGNRVKAENLRQHAEHYLRIVNAIESTKQAAREEQEAKAGEQSDDENSDDEAGDTRSRRRYPPRARRNEGSDSKSDNETQTSSDAEKASESDAPVAAKSTRRRKAPAREAAEDTAVTEAAE